MTIHEFLKWCKNNRRIMDSLNRFMQDAERAARDVPVNDSASEVRGECSDAVPCPPQPQADPV